MGYEVSGHLRGNLEKVGDETAEFRTAQPRDHCPIRLQLQVAVGHEYKVDSNFFRWNYTAMKDPAKVRQFCETYRQWRNQAAIEERFSNALQQPSPESTWDILNGGISSAAKVAFATEPNNNKRQWTTQQTTQLNQQVREAHQQLEQTPRIEVTAWNQKQENTSEFLRSVLAGGGPVASCGGGKETIATASGETSDNG